MRPLLVGVLLISNAAIAEREPEMRENTTVSDPGSEPRRNLRLAPTVGATAPLSLQFKMDMLGAAPQHSEATFDVESRVTEIANSRIHFALRGVGLRAGPVDDPRLAAYLAVEGVRHRGLRC
jgi:hypothetical protein